jgi:hypothetical protein
MINFQRSGSIAPGKTAAALSFAREVTAYIKTKTGYEVKVGMPIGGNPNRICWPHSRTRRASYCRTRNTWN